MGTTFGERLPVHADFVWFCSLYLGNLTFIPYRFIGLLMDCGSKRWVWCVCEGHRLLRRVWPAPVLPRDTEPLPGGRCNRVCESFQSSSFLRFASLRSFFQIFPGSEMHGPEARGEGCWWREEELAHKPHVLYTQYNTFQDKTRPYQYNTLQMQIQ